MESQALQRKSVRPGSFFDKLDPDSQQTLLARGTQQYLGRGESLRLQRSSNDSVYLIMSGRARIHHLTAGGKEVILWFCCAGDIFNLSEAASEHRRLYAAACEPCKLLAVSRMAFKTWLLNNPPAALAALETLGQRLSQLGDLVQNLVATDVTGRVIELMARLGELYGHGNDRHVEIPITHQELADMIGSSRQSVTSALNALQREGFVQLKNRRLHIELDSLMRRRSMLA